MDLNRSRYLAGSPNETGGIGHEALRTNNDARYGSMHFERTEELGGK